MKKGISTIIAVVLLLLITIGIVWSVYNFLTGATGTITQGAGSAIEKKTEILTTDFTITAAGYAGNNQGQVSITNTGTKDIDLSKITVYVKGVQQTIISGNSGTLTLGNPATITYQNTTAICGETVRVAYAGVTKESVIEC